MTEERHLRRCVEDVRRGRLPRRAFIDRLTASGVAAPHVGPGAKGPCTMNATLFRASQEEHDPVARHDAGLLPGGTRPLVP